MTVPLDVRNDIRSMDARGVPRAEIARELHLSRNTVARYADMEDLSPAPPLPEERPRPALEEHVAWVDAVLEADLGAPRKQRHTAKRLYDRLVEERGYEGSYSTVQRHVREWRLARGAGAGGGYLELEWAPGTAQADYGSFEAALAGERAHLKLLALTLPHSVNVNLSFTDSVNGPLPFAPTHMRRPRQPHPPLSASRSGARSLVR